MSLLWSFPCFSEEPDIAYWALPFEYIQGRDFPTFIIYRQRKNQQETVGFWESRHRVQTAYFKNLIYSPREPSSDPFMFYYFWYSWRYVSVRNERAAWPRSGQFPGIGDVPNKQFSGKAAGKHAWGRTECPTNALLASLYNVLSTACHTIFCFHYCPKSDSFFLLFFCRRIILTIIISKSRNVTR